MRFAIALALCAAACGHTSPTPARAGASDAGVAPAPVDVEKAAAEISQETHALLRSEADLLWKRWTTGAGAMPASALAEHPLATSRESLDVVSAALVKRPNDVPLQLLRQQLATMQVSREAAAEIDALDRARAQLSFAAPGDARAERSERELDRLLTDEPDAKKRLAIAQAEAKAAQPLAPLVIARDAAVDKAIAALRLQSWTALEERAHGVAVADLAALAERTLAATEEISSKAVAAMAVRNIGVTADRLRRADLPRLIRSALADPQFPAGHAFPLLKDVLSRIAVEPPPSLHVDAEPSPSKGARPLALLVDPPSDVRLSLRPAGGFEEQRATLHEGARAVGGALITSPRWEQARLGDGSAAEAAAQLFEELTGDPVWLREVTQIRGEPLDDLVHTQVARRLLSARRAAALVLFEIRRREEGFSRTPEAQAALYRGLVQRATFAVLGDDDASRWTLEAEPWIRTAAQLEGAILAAQLEAHRAPDGSPWWKSPDSGPLLRTLWVGGRSLTAMEAARALGLTTLDPAALAKLGAARLAYAAPEAPPPTPKPDYKYMQPDKKPRRRKKHK